MNRIVTLLKSHPKKTVALGVLLVSYYLCLPKNLFNSPTSTVIESRQGTLLGAKIADDGQWRFPMTDTIPEKFKTCLIQFEDAYFYLHPGFNLFSMTKALLSNLKAGRTIRGGSTLTQQVIRLSRNSRKRSYFEKLIELILATRLELRDSKQEILKLYASNAPFGGNVVGLEVAAWRYFGLKPSQMSWAESATLAVLPNSPGLIYPGKNQNELLKKRNSLLQKLLDQKIIDSTAYNLALLEELPQSPFPLPKIAPHLVEYMVKKNKGKRVRTTLNENLQQNVNFIVQRHYENLRQNQIHNSAVLVMNVHTREILAYVGNTQTSKEHHKDVDLIQANRSTGSILKPFLYAAMLDAGELLPDMLVADVPTQIAGYSPENYDEDYSGAVKAKNALARSLNIPAVRLLQSYGLEKFRDQLDFFKLRGINKSADHYGLTLILGGAESNLWDLCKTYANLASTVNHFGSNSSEYFDLEFTNPILERDQLVSFGKRSFNKTFFDAGSIYLTFDAMKEVNRPEGNESWEFYDSSKEIAWKTGTSFGNKDAWAIGVTTDYVVGIWVGNADGEGRPNLTGVSSAAPILFDVFDLLPKSKWFEKPLDEFSEIEICAESGYLATDMCPIKKTLIPNKHNFVESCSYHQIIHLDAQKQYQVNSSCADLSQTISMPWFVLPPLMEFYFKRTHPGYSPLPSFRRDCLQIERPPMEFIYPKNGSRITLAKNFEGKMNEIIFKLAHNKPETKIYWYLDDKFVLQTQNFHEIGLLPDIGKHKITAMEELGSEISVVVFIE